METGDGLTGTDGDGLAGREGGGLAVENSDHTVGEVADGGTQGEGVGDVVVVAHLRLGVDGGASALHVDVGGVDVGAGGAEVAVEGQRLVEPSRQV